MIADVEKAALGGLTMPPGPNTVALTPRMHNRNRLGFGLRSASDLGGATNGRDDALNLV